jgi:hypothetical protein
MYRVIQVLPPERKHPLLIDLKFTKNSGTTVTAVEHFVKISIFLRETSKYFVLITPLH